MNGPARSSAFASGSSLPKRIQHPESAAGLTNGGAVDGAAREGSGGGLSVRENPEALARPDAVGLEVVVIDREDYG